MVAGAKLIFSVIVIFSVMYELAARLRQLEVGTAQAASAAQQAELRAQHVEDGLQQTRGQFQADQQAS